MRVRPGGPRPTLPAAAAAVAGRGLGFLSWAAAVLRRSKPLHPVGVVAGAVLTVDPATVASGSPLLDEPGERHCLVRASYAVGTGPEHTDIEGFALRVLPIGVDDARSDLLFASTGVGR